MCGYQPQKYTIEYSVKFFFGYIILLIEMLVNV